MERELKSLKGTPSFSKKIRDDKTDDDNNEQIEKYKNSAGSASASTDPQVTSNGSERDGPPNDSIGDLDKIRERSTGSDDTETESAVQLSEETASFIVGALTKLLKCKIFS